MVCNFCPGSGSPAEKTFNRADVFKRHLTHVHNVEQTPPNSRKRSSAGQAADGMGGVGPSVASGYPADATGKCSTCSGTFSNAQDFYEHLDECVLRVVQQGDPSEAINERNLATVESDEAVLETLRGHALPVDGADSSSSPRAAGPAAAATGSDGDECGQGDGSSAADWPATTTTTPSTATATTSTSGSGPSRSGRGMIGRPQTRSQ
jgi:hypothetical protein